MRRIQYEISDDGAFARVRVRSVNGAPKTIELDYDGVVELGLVMGEIDAEMTAIAMGGEGE